MSVPDTEALVEAYFEHADWERQRERAENTSEAVQTLAEALVESDREIGSDELTALYNLAQHDDIYGHEKKREAVEQFDLDDETREQIFACFDGPVGIVGKGTTTVDVDGNEEAATEFLRDFVHTGSSRGRYRVLEAFADRGVSGIQAGIVSALAYALYPEEYPIVNGPARDGMAKYFDREVSGQLSDYLETAGVFREVREAYEFDDNFRHLDYFFQWAEDCLDGEYSSVYISESGEVRVTDDVSSERDAFWVNQNNHSELRDGYLYAGVDDVWHHDLERLDIGDFVFHNLDNELIAVSRVDSRPEYHEFRGEQYHRVDVSMQFLEGPVPLDESLRSHLNDPDLRLDEHYPLRETGDLKQAYCSELSTEAANWLFSRLGVSPSDWDDEDDSTDPLDVPDDPPARHDTVARQLDATGQVVLTGPPGTGKTHTARQFARWWVGEQTDTPTADQVQTVTFHPAFAYEDFLEGLTATTVGDGDGDDADAGDDATDADTTTDATGVTYEIEPGRLREIATDAREAYEAVDDADDAPPYVLVIDEINRGDLPQILGEAITLLEPGERDRREVSLAHSGEPFSLPPNLYLIGTMNTADQSIALVDAALRRRFRFLHLPPAPERVLEIERDGDAETDAEAVVTDESASPQDRLLAASVTALETLNRRIREDAARLERGQQLGHTALLGHDDARGVADAWQFELLPQLAEYYYGQTDALRRELFGGDGGDGGDGDGGDALFDWERGVPSEFDPETLYDALCAVGGVDGDAVALDPGADDE